MKPSPPLEDRGNVSSRRAGKGGIRQPTLSSSLRSSKRFEAEKHAPPPVGSLPSLYSKNRSLKGLSEDGIAASQSMTPPSHIKNTKMLQALLNQTTEEDIPSDPHAISLVGDDWTDFADEMVRVAEYRAEQALKGKVNDTERMMKTLSDSIKDLHAHLRLLQDCEWLLLETAKAQSRALEVGMALSEAYRIRMQQQSQDMARLTYHHESLFQKYQSIKHKDKEAEKEKSTSNSESMATTSPKKRKDVIRALQPLSLQGFVSSGATSLLPPQAKGLEVAIDAYCDDLTSSLELWSSFSATCQIQIQRLNKLEKTLLEDWKDKKRACSLDERCLGIDEYTVGAYLRAGGNLDSSGRPQTAPEFSGPPATSRPVTSGRRETSAATVPATSRGRVQSGGSWKPAKTSEQWRRETHHRQMELKRALTDVQRFLTLMSKHHKPAREVNEQLTDNLRRELGREVHRLEHKLDFMRLLRQNVGEHLDTRNKLVQRFAADLATKEKPLIVVRQKLEVRRQRPSLEFVHDSAEEALEFQQRALIESMDLLSKRGADLRDEVNALRTEEADIESEVSCILQSIRLLERCSAHHTQTQRESSSIFRTLGSPPRPIKKRTQRQPQHAPDKSTSLPAPSEAMGSSDFIARSPKKKEASWVVIGEPIEDIPSGLEDERPAEFSEPAAKRVESAGRRNSPKRDKNQPQPVFVNSGNPNQFNHGTVAPHSRESSAHRSGKLEEPESKGFPAFSPRKAVHDSKQRTHQVQQLLRNMNYTKSPQKSHLGLGSDVSFGLLPSHSIASTRPQGAGNGSATVSLKKMRTSELSYSAASIAKSTLDYFPELDLKEEGLSKSTGLAGSGFVSVGDLHLASTDLIDPPEPHPDDEEEEDGRGDAEGGEGGERSGEEEYQDSDHRDVEINEF